MIKLVCRECQRENEPERIYCHDCGARLDRSGLAKVVPKQEHARETQWRLRSDGIQMRQIFFRFSNLIIVACAAAALIQMIRPPAVPLQSKGAGFPPQISLELENAVSQKMARPLQYSQDQVNGYLGNVLRNEQARLSPLLKLKHAVIAFDENSCRINVELSLFGYSIFAATTNNVTIQSETLVAVSKGGSIGRLSIHPLLMKLSEPLFHHLLAALEHERELAAKMASIEFHPETVILTPKQ